MLQPLFYTSYFGHKGGDGPTGVATRPDRFWGRQCLDNLFYAPPSFEGEQCGPKEGCSVTEVDTGLSRCPIPGENDHIRPRRPTCSCPAKSPPSS